MKYGKSRLILVQFAIILIRGLEYFESSLTEPHLPPQRRVPKAIDMLWISEQCWKMWHMDSSTWFGPECTVTARKIQKTTWERHLAQSATLSHCVFSVTLSGAYTHAIRVCLGTHLDWTVISQPGTRTGNSFSVIWIVLYGNERISRCLLYRLLLLYVLRTRVGKDTAAFSLYKKRVYERCPPRRRY